MPTVLSVWIQLGSHLARLSRFQWFYETAASRSGATSADDILCVGAAWLALARLFTLLLRFVLRLPHVRWSVAVDCIICECGDVQRGLLIEFSDGIRLWDGLLECRVDGDTLEVSGGYVGGFWLFRVGTFIDDPFLPSYPHHAWGD